MHQSIAAENGDVGDDLIPATAQRIGRDHDLVQPRRRLFLGRRAVGDGERRNAGEDEQGGANGHTGKP